MYSFNQFSVILTRLDELLLTIIFISLFFIYFLFPFNKYFLNKILSSEKFGNIDAIGVNIIFHSLIFLLISFLNVNKLNFGYIIIFLSVSVNLIYFKKNFTKDNRILNLIYLTLVIVFCLKLSSYAALEWDGLGHWFYKTQIFFQGGNIHDLNKVVYSFYPHLGPYVWSFFWKLSNSEFEYLGRFFYIFIFISSLFCLSSRINNYNLKILFFISSVLLLTEFTLFGGYQEYFLFSIITIFSCFYFFFEETFQKNKIKFSLFYLAILVLLPWIKDEGLVGSFLLLIIIMLTKKYNFKEKIFFLISYLILILISYEIEKNIKTSVDFQFAFDYKNLFNNFLNIKFIFNSITYIIFEYLKVFLRYPIWILIFISSFYVLRDMSDNKGYSIILVTTFFIKILIFFLFYMLLFISVQDLEPIWHLQTSTFRLILSISGLYLVMLVFFINLKENLLIK